MVSALPLKERETEVNHADIKPCLCDEAPPHTPCTPQKKRTLDTKTWVSFPGWRYSTHVITHQYCLWFHGERTTENSTSGSLESPHGSLFLANFNLYPVPTINHNDKYNRSQWVSSTRLSNLSGSGETPELAFVVKSEGSLGHCTSSNFSHVFTESWRDNKVHVVNVLGRLKLEDPSKETHFQARWQPF